MKELQYKNRYDKWVVKYRRPDNHSDVKEWEEHIAKTPHTRYRIVTEAS